MGWADGGRRTGGVGRLPLPDGGGVVQRDAADDVAQVETAGVVGSPCTPARDSCAATRALRRCSGAARSPLLSGLLTRLLRAGVGLPSAAPAWMPHHSSLRRTASQAVVRGGRRRDQRRTIFTAAPAPAEAGRAWYTPGATGRPSSARPSQEAPEPPRRQCPPRPTAKRRCARTRRSRPDRARCRRPGRAPRRGEDTLVRVRRHVAPVLEEHEELPSHAPFGSVWSWSAETRIRPPGGSSPPPFSSKRQP